MEEEKAKRSFGGKKLYLTLVLGAVGILLIILGSSGFLSGREEKTAETRSEETVFSYTEFLEKKVARMVSRLCGGEVSVLITLDCSSESVYAGNISENTGTGTTEREYLVLRGENSEEGLFLKEIYPRIRGIAVVCPGGGSSGTQLEVIKMLSVAFGISSSRVSVSGAG
ncbi:MAG: hypothetical protein IKV54_06925 [Clostridia bacterium]|nr:hypothetical protein [Clostridia bacterium]